MPRPSRVFVAGGVNHVCNEIGRGKMVRVEGYDSEVWKLAATLMKTTDGMSHTLGLGVRPKAHDRAPGWTSRSWAV